MKIRIFLTFFIILYFAWHVYQRNGWDHILTLEIIFIACFGAGFQASELLKDYLSRYGEPTFPLVIIFILSVISLNILSSPPEHPLSKFFDINNWDENFLLVLLGWFNWSFAISAFIFAIKDHSKEESEN